MAIPEIPTPSQLFDQARSLVRTGPWIDAQTLLEQAVSSTTDVSLLVDLHLHMGSTCKLQRNYSAAQKHFEITGYKAWKLEDRERELEAVVGLMDLTLVPNKDTMDMDLEPAREWSRVIRGFLDEDLVAIQPTPAKVKALTQLGLLDIEEGKPYQALDTLELATQKAHELLTDGENVDLLDLYAHTLYVMGVASLTVGNMTQALTVQRMAFQIYNQTQNLRGIGNTALALGDTYMRTGETEKAKIRYAGALRSATDGKGRVLDTAVYMQAGDKLNTIPPLPAE